MDILKMLRSFKYAINGIWVLFSKENNAKFHLLIACLVVAFGVYFDIEKHEWFAILFCIFFVFSAEAFNTAIEKLCDKFHPERDPIIGRIKDLAAAGVLFATICSVLVGIMIFWRHIW